MPDQFETPHISPADALSAVTAPTLPPALVTAADRILSTMPLSDWRGSITTFNGFTGTRPASEQNNLPWDAISGVFCPQKPVIRHEKKSAQYFVPCQLKEGPLVGNTLAMAIQYQTSTTGKMRSKSHVTEASCLTIDLDGLDESEFDAGLAKLRNDGLTYTAFTTHSHGRADKPGIRARLAVPLDRPVDTTEYPTAWHGFDQRYFGGRAGQADSSGANLYQQQGTWCVHPDRRHQARSWHNSGGVAAADALIAIGRNVLAAKAVQSGIATAASENTRIHHESIGATTYPSSTVVGEYPVANANRVADACLQIGTFRDTKGANQREPLWYDCLGVVVYCENGESYCHEWSSGHSGYDVEETAKKLEYRMKVPPTTCSQFQKSNPAGCIGCVKQCKSPIALGWKDSSPGVSDAEMNAAVEQFEVIASDTEAAAGNANDASAGRNSGNPISLEPAANVPQVTESDRYAVLSLNDEFAFIEEHASIFREKFGNFIEPAKFRLQHDNITINIVSGNKVKSAGLGSSWLASPQRRQHTRLVLRPGEGHVTADNCLNEWQGFVIDPAKGNVKTFLRLLVRMMPNRAARRYVQKWMAHLIQKPGVKIFVSLAIWSHAQGVGKNLLFETLVAVIGATHATVIGQEELGGSFNGWANRRILVIGDEVSGSDKRQQNDKLKGLITGTTVHVNEKFQPDREQPNLLNFVFLSNHHDALFVNDHDRRFFVWEIEAGRLPEAQATAFVHWRDNGGLAALHHWLLNYPLGDFNPKAPAPMTVAKQQMAQDNRSDLEAWLADLLASGVAAAIGRELATAHELGLKYQMDTGHKGTSSKAIVGAAKRFGLYARPDQVRLADGRKVRVLALARQEHWRGQLESAWAQEMAKPLKFLEFT